MGHSQGGATGKLVICWVARARGAPMAPAGDPRAFHVNRLQRAQAAAEPLDTIQMFPAPWPESAQRLFSTLQGKPLGRASHTLAVLSR